MAESAASSRMISVDYDFFEPLEPLVMIAEQNIGDVVHLSVDGANALLDDGKTFIELRELRLEAVQLALGPFKPSRDQACELLT